MTTILGTEFVRGAYILSMLPPCYQLFFVVVEISEYIDFDALVKRN